MNLQWWSMIKWWIIMVHDGLRQWSTMVNITVNIHGWSWLVVVNEQWLSITWCKYGWMTVEWLSMNLWHLSHVFILISNRHQAEPHVSQGVLRHQCGADGILAHSRPGTSATDADGANLQHLTAVRWRSMTLQWWIIGGLVLNDAKWLLKVIKD